jgi:hypothetical protein
MATQPISIQGECAALLSGLDGVIAALEKLPKLTDEERADWERDVGLAGAVKKKKPKGRPKKVPWVGGREEFKSDYVDVARAAQVLGKKPQWVYDHTSRAEPIIPHYRPGGPDSAPMFVETELHDFMRAARHTTLKMKYQSSHDTQ